MTDSPLKPTTDSYVRTLPEAECFELLAVATVGRIGFVSPAGVQIIPVNYRLGAGHRLFLKTAPSGALAQLAEIEAPVAFEVDYHAADFRIAWSVLMNGTISRLDAGQQRRTGISACHPSRGPGPPVPCSCTLCRGRCPGGASSAPAPTKGGPPRRPRTWLLTGQSMITPTEVRLSGFSDRSGP